MPELISGIFIQNIIFFDNNIYLKILPHFEQIFFFFFKEGGWKQLRLPLEVIVFWVNPGILTT